MFPIPSHISLYYRSYIFRTEWNGPDFGKRNMCWNGTEHCFKERIIFGTARNGSSLIYLYGRDRERDRESERERGIDRERKTKSIIRKRCRAHFSRMFPLGHVPLAEKSGRQFLKEADPLDSTAPIGSVLQIHNSLPRLVGLIKFLGGRV